MKLSESDLQPLLLKTTAEIWWELRMKPLIRASTIDLATKYLTPVEIARIRGRLVLGHTLYEARFSSRMFCMAQQDRPWGAALQDRCENSRSQRAVDLIVNLIANNNKPKAVSVHTDC